MHHYDKFAHSPRDRTASDRINEGAAIRLLAAMADAGRARPGRSLRRTAAPGHPAYQPAARESDRDYYGRRSQEERAAAAMAAGAEAERAHRDLSLLLAQRAAPAPRWRRVPDSGTGRLRLAAASRARRQDALLDAALLETFPASDPVSVVLVG